MSNSMSHFQTPLVGNGSVSPTAYSALQSISFSHAMANQDSKSHPRPRASSINLVSTGYHADDPDDHDDDDADDDEDTERSFMRTVSNANQFVLRPELDREEDGSNKPDLNDIYEVDGGYDRPVNPSIWSIIQRRAPYYIPILHWLPRYKPREYLLQDLLAGLTVGVILVPQGLIYAGIAGLPPLYGLYSAFFPLLIYLILGSSRHLSIGPEVTTSILIGKTAISVVQPTLGAHQEIGNPLIQEEYIVPVVMALSLMIGVFSLSLGLLRLGFLDSILSRPILAGFLTAVALTLISEQCNTLIGVPHDGGDSAAQALIHALSNLQHTNVLTLLISLFCIFFIFGASYFKKCFPDRKVIQCMPDILMVIVIVTIVSYAFDFESHGVVILGKMEDGFRAPKFPSLNHFGDSFLVTSALTITLLGFVESQLVSKKVANKFNYTISPNRELVALGSASIFSSFFGGYSAFGSIARTKVNVTAGGRTNVVNLVAAFVSCLAILFLLPLFRYTPKAVTASIIFSVACSLFEFHEMQFVYRVRQWKDFILMIGMTVVTYVFGVDSGIFFAFASCLLLAVKQTTMPSVNILGRGFVEDQFGQLTDLEKAVQDIEGVLVYKIEGPLFFANAEKLKDSTRRMEKYGGFHVHPSEPAKPMNFSSIIFDMSSLTSVDASALAIIEEIVEVYVEQGKRVCFVKLPRKILYKFQLAGILEKVGFENLFRTLEDVLASLKSDNSSGLSRSRTELTPRLANQNDKIQSFNY